MQVYLETFGCQMNEYDSDIVKTLLAKEEFSLTRFVDHADVILFNTCAVRENAHNKVFGRIQQVGHLKKTNKNLVVGVLGCMAQNLGEDFPAEGKMVDIIAGPDSYRKLPTLIKKVLKLKGSQQRPYSQKGKETLTALDLELDRSETYEDIFPRQEGGTNAWISIMRGCNNFCTFCVVPYTRGRERSRALSSITEEAKALIRQGFRQITLLGQNVNSYRHEEGDFADLMGTIARLPGIERVRFTSPHPKDFPDRFLQTMKTHPKMSPHIHLPLQSGSTRILDKMNRGYTREEYLALVDRIRKHLPDVSLSTDIIVGFPGEEEGDYFQTLDIVERVGFHSAYIFKYSERKGTLAEKKYPETVSEEVKSSRINHLVTRQKEITLEKLQARVGQVEEILVEGPSKKNPEMGMGRSPHNHPVIFPNFSQSSLKSGDMALVKIDEVTVSTLYGRLTQKRGENSPLAC